MSFAISPSIAAGMGCSRKSGLTPFSHAIFFFASSTLVQPSFASTVMGLSVTERIAAMFSSSFGSPILIFSFGNAAASRTFCFMTSAVSMPIENVVTGMRPFGTPRSSCTGPVQLLALPVPEREVERGHDLAVGPRLLLGALQPREVLPGREARDGRLHARERRLRRLEALVPALVRGGLAVAGHALRRQRQEAVFLRRPTSRARSSTCARA